jgi:hypothetical protein
MCAFKFFFQSWSTTQIHYIWTNNTEEHTALNPEQGHSYHHQCEEHLPIQVYIQPSPQYTHKSG